MKVNTEMIFKSSQLYKQYTYITIIATQMQETNHNNNEGINNVIFLGQRDGGKDQYRHEKFLDSEVAFVKHTKH